MQQKRQKAKLKIQWISILLAASFLFSCDAKNNSETMPMSTDEMTTPPVSETVFTPEPPETQQSEIIPARDEAAFSLSVSQLPSLTAPQINVCNIPISEFVITTDGSDLTSAAAELIAARIQEICGISLPVTDRTEGSEHCIRIVTNTENDGDISLTFGNDIFISAPARRIETAVLYFCRDLLCDAPTTADGTLCLTEAMNIYGDLIPTPVDAASYPDPFVRYVNGYYYALCTRVDCIMLQRSKTLSGLVDGECRIVYRPTDSDGIIGDIWASEFYYDPAEGRWYIYASGAISPGEERIFCIVSAHDALWDDYAFGNIFDVKRYSLDPSLFYQEETDTLYMVYAKVSGGIEKIFISQMLDPLTMAKQAVCLAAPTYSWELQRGKIAEAPCIFRSGNGIYLAYSVNDASSRFYSVGLLTFTGNPQSDLLTDSSLWKKAEIPLLSPNESVFGTGHCSVFRASDGSLWIAYHGRTDPADTTWERPLLLSPLDTDDNGVPLLGQTPHAIDRFIVFPSECG